MAKLDEFNIRSKQFRKLTTKAEIVIQDDNPLISEDIIRYIEKIKPTNSRTRIISKKKQLDAIPENATVPKLEQKGLNDNINIDADFKDKAKKGLLYLLNKLSGNKFCPEIDSYFEQVKKEKRANRLLMEDAEAQSIKKNEISKNLRRQNFIDKFEPRNLLKKQSDDDFLKINTKKGTFSLVNQGKQAQNNAVPVKPISLNLKRRSEMNENNRNEKNEYAKRNLKSFKEDLTDKDLELFFCHSDVLNTYRKFEISNEKRLLKESTSPNLSSKRKQRRKKQESSKFKQIKSQTLNKSNINSTVSQSKEKSKIKVNEKNIDNLERYDNKSRKSKEMQGLLKKVSIRNYSEEDEVQD